MKCRTTGIVLLFHVPNTRRETIIPILAEHADEDATILSDMASIYVNTRNGESFLEQLGFEHHYINHSQHYVHPIQNWLHTNNIEGTWRRLKSHVSHVKKNVKDSYIEDYLTSFMFKTSLKKDQIFEVLIEILAESSKELIN
jgi:hypothetical protein